MLTESTQHTTHNTAHSTLQPPTLCPSHPHPAYGFCVRASCDSMNESMCVCVCSWDYSCCYRMYPRTISSPHRKPPTHSSSLARSAEIQCNEHHRSVFETLKLGSRVHRSIIGDEMLMKDDTNRNNTLSHLSEQPYQPLWCYPFWVVITFSLCSQSHSP